MSEMEMIDIDADAAREVEAAVLARHPDAIVERVSADAEGYTVEVALANGSNMLVFLSDDFVVISQVVFSLQDDT